jgi:hypothetical protein
VPALDGAAFSWRPIGCKQNKGDAMNTEKTVAAFFLGAVAALSFGWAWGFVALAAFVGFLDRA